MKEFYKSLLKSPSQISSIVPSSRFLAKAMCQFIQLSEEESIIEVGPGTGAITQAILNKIHSPSQLTLIEKNKVLYRYLRKYFNDINLLHCGIEEFEKKQQATKHKLKYIVSSLPLMSMPEAIKKQCIDAMIALLPPKGYLIQYTYHLFKKEIIQSDILALKEKRLVLLNLPPAKVLLYQKIQ